MMVTDTEDVCKVLIKGWWYAVVPGTFRETEGGYEFEYTERGSYGQTMTMTASGEVIEAVTRRKVGN